MVKKTTGGSLATQTESQWPRPLLNEVPQACEDCAYWQRIAVKKTMTSFGVCYRWADLMVENRDGVSSAPMLPQTPELASCHEWKANPLS